MKTKNLLIIAVFLVIALLIINQNTPNNKQKEAFQGNLSAYTQTETQDTFEQKECHEITGNIKKGETLFDIFKKHELDMEELNRWES